MDVDGVLARLARNAGAPDLAALALHLARDAYRDLDVDAYLSELASMGREAKAYVRGDLDGRVTGLCRYLFHEMGFRGNTQDYYDPRNSYLNDVLDRRTGIPITLALVAMAVGRPAGLEVVGVGLPGHFVAKAVAGRQEILFDPFHGGRRLSPTDCEILVQQVTSMPFRATPQSLEALPPRLLVIRMLTNLKTAYLRRHDFSRAVRVIERLRQISPDDSSQRRDLGICLLHAGQPGRAIDPLAAYLAANPAPTDTAAVRQLLDQALAAVGRWN